MSPRPLNRAEKHVASRHLLHSWHMVAWAAATAHALEAGTPAELRAAYGITTAVHVRRLVSFYFPTHRSNELHAGRLLPSWSPPAPPAAIRSALAYVSSLIVHLTESHLAHPDRLPVPNGGEWLAHLAPVHNDWLRAMIRDAPEDLAPEWARNLRCFTMLSNSEPLKEDGESRFQTDNMQVRFFTLDGAPSSEPPEFLARFVRQS